MAASRARSAFRVFVRCWASSTNRQLRSAFDHPLPQQIELRPSEHLPFDELHPVDVPFRLKGHNLLVALTPAIAGLP